jgi:hypothetical protein
MLSQVPTVIVDPATGEKVHTYASEYNQGTNAGGDKSIESHMAANVVEGHDNWTLDPSARARVYTRGEVTDDEMSPVQFDLATGEVKPFGSADFGDLPFTEDEGSLVGLLGATLDDDELVVFDAAKLGELWRAKNVTGVCAANDKHVAVEANDQVAVLDRRTGEQIAYNDTVGSTGFGNSACASTNVAGFGWNIQDGPGGGSGTNEIVSYFDQTVG